MSSPLEKLLVSLGFTYRRHREKLDSIVEKARVVAEEMGCRAILFGSVARGDDEPASDIDIMIICEDIPPSARERARIQAYIEERLGLQEPHPVHIVVVTPAEATLLM